jgi:TRAP-type C4-dicarboxylate transport system permease small subunit
MKQKRHARVTQVMEFVMAMLLAAMALIVFLNVILRYAFSSGINGTEDIARLLFIWLCFIGAVVVMGQRQHLGVDVLLKKLPRPARRLAGLLSHALMAMALGLLLYGSWGQMILNHGTMAMGAIAYPLSWGYAAGVFAAVGCLVYVLRDAVQLLKGSEPQDDTP